MADNVTVDNAALPDYTVATDEELGVGQHQYAKVEFGADGTFSKVTSALGLPVNPVQETAGVGIGAAADVEAVGNGSLIAILKRLRTLVGGGLPAALVGGRLDVNVGSTAIPAVVTTELAFTVAQTDVAIVSAVAPDRIVVTRCDVDLDEAATVGVGFRVGLGAVSTPTTTGVVNSHPGIVAGGGAFKGDGSGVLGIGAAGEDLRITAEVPTGGSARVIVSHYLTT